MEFAVSAPVSPLSPLRAAPLSALWAIPLSPRWPLYQAIVPQGESGAHQSKYHCLCLLSQLDQQRQPLFVLSLPL
jgi:hypothetical protein